MFGIQVSLYFFINSLLTITIFPNIVIITIIYDYRETTHVTIIVFHGLSVCCPFFSGLLFRLTASSRPGFPYSPFSSNAVSSPNFQVQTSLHSERSARWRCKLFSVDRVTDQRSAQVMNPVNKWPLQRTHAREKLFCSWRELNPDRPVASPTFYL